MKNILGKFFKRIKIRKTQVKSFYKVKDQEKTKNQENASLLKRSGKLKESHRNRKG